MLGVATAAAAKEDGESPGEMRATLFLIGSFMFVIVSAAANSIVVICSLRAAPWGRGWGRLVHSGE